MALRRVRVAQPAPHGSYATAVAKLTGRVTFEAVKSRRSTYVLWDQRSAAAPMRASACLSSARGQAKFKRT